MPLGEDPGGRPDPAWRLLILGLGLLARSNSNTETTLHRPPVRPVDRQGVLKRHIFSKPRAADELLQICRNLWYHGSRPLGKAVVTNEQDVSSSLPGLDTYRQIIRFSGIPLSETPSVNSPDSANRPESDNPGPPDETDTAKLEPTDPGAPEAGSVRTPDPDSDSLSSCVLGQIKAKDPQAWERMVKLYGPMIYRWARRGGLQSADSADIVQEVFRAVALYIAEFEAERTAEGFRAWLWTITKNALIDHFRKQSGATGSADDAFEATVAHEPEFPEPDDLKTPSPDVAMVHRVLHNIRTDFEDTTWDAFWETTVLNRTAAEAGESLNMSKSAVRQAKYRVLKRLRDELSGA